MDHKALAAALHVPVQQKCLSHISVGSFGSDVRQPAYDFLMSSRLPIHSACRLVCIFAYKDDYAMMLGPRVALITGVMCIRASREYLGGK